MAQAANNNNNNSKKIAVITGVSSGIGLALVKEFIANDWLVFGCARRQSKIDELNKEYPSKDVENAPYFSSIDVTDEQGIKNWSDMILTNYGTPTVVVANAGIGQEPILIEDTESKLFDKIMGVNVKGLFLLSHYFLPSMKKLNNNSVIIGMSSGAGRLGFKGMATYCASKWALEGFISSMSKELENMNVFAVSYDPLIVATDQFQVVYKLDETQMNDYTAKIPTSEDLAKEFLPHVNEILQKPKEYNGKQLTTPIMSNEKYAPKVQAAFKVFEENAMKKLDDVKTDK